MTLRPLPQCCGCYRQTSWSGEAQSQIEGAILLIIIYFSWLPNCANFKFSSNSCGFQYGELGAEPQLPEDNGGLGAGANEGLKGSAQRTWRFLHIFQKITNFQTYFY